MLNYYLAIAEVSSEGPALSIAESAKYQLPLSLVVKRLSIHL